MSSSQLVHKLVRQTNAEHGATPVPILHVSSYSSEQLMYMTVTVQTALAGRVAGHAAMHKVFSSV